MKETQDKHYILAVSVLTAFSGLLMLSAVTVAVPQMGSELSMNAVQLGWMSQAFSLASAIFVLPFGRLADIWGRKKIFTIGLILATVSTLLMALSNSFLMVIILRVLQGTGFAMVYCTGMALVTSAYPLSERGKVLGINIAAVYLGWTLGPTIGGIMTQNLGWRSVFLLALVFQVVSLVILFAKIRREWADAKGQKFDITGSILFSIMLFCIMYGFTSLPATTGIWLIAIGIIGAIAFIMWEHREKSPILNIRLFMESKLFAFASLTQLIYFSATFSVPFILSLYLQYNKGLSPQDAGFVLLAQPFIQAVLATVAGRMSDRIQPRVIISSSMIPVLAGLIVLLMSLDSTTLIPIIVSQLLLGLGSAFFLSPNTNAIMSSVEKEYFGVASATESVTRNAGIAVSMSILMLLFSVHMGTAEIKPEYFAAFVESIRWALIISIGLGLCCVVVSVLRGKTSYHGVKE
jgi:EmrB/QacA subfamily drug resistance transporter